MLLGIDHLVIAVHDPDAAASTLERHLGIACTGGGRHEAWGTFNRLAFLGDTYLELIGVFDRALAGSATGSAVARSTLAVLDAGGEGLASFALATDDIEGDVARLRGQGSAISPPVDGFRARPDGEVVRWRTAAASVGPGEPPFLIEHENAGAEWGEAARAARAAFEHPAGGRVRLASLEVPCADAASAAAAFARTLGLTFVAAADGGLEARIGPQVVRLSRARRSEPTVTLAGDALGRLDLLRCGILWRSPA